MDAESFYRVLRDGSPDDRLALLEALPDTGFKDAASGLVASDRPGSVVLGFVPVAVRLCGGVNPTVGMPLALATHRLAVELFEENADHAGLLLMTLSNLAQQYANACNLLGDSDSALAFTERWIPYYTRLDERENVPGLKAARINALLNAHRLDDAQSELEDPTLRGNWATDIEVARLEGVLAQLRRSVTEDKRAAAAEARATAQGAPAVSDEIQRAVLTAVQQTIDDPGQKSEITESLAKLFARAKPSDVSDPATFRRLIESLAEGEAYLTKGQTSESELTIRRRIREASAIFITERPSPETIRQSLAVLEECLEWTKARGHTELMNDALWAIYLCRARLGDPSRAADAVLALRANLEADRASIEEPLERGGVFSRYPHLFAALCEQLQKAGRTDALLEAIEASKGRGVADILTRKSGRAVADATIYSVVKSLPALTRQHDFHYLTFFVDEAQTYAALVSKSGEIHAVPPAPLGRAAIREASLRADPRDWGRRQSDNPGRVLAPLVEALGDFLANKVIEVGDHLCYAADEDLSNVPLQYLRIRGKPLIDYVSLSRIHNALHLEQVLAAGSAPPTSFRAFVVPTIQNTERDSWPELQRYMRQPAERLRRHLEGDNVENTEASIERLMRSDLRGRILHFSAHGTFPLAEDEGTPFERSGILLAFDGQLPDLERLQAGDFTGVLTPHRVLDSKLDLSGSHVSLMTCVSGLSREGLGGDALGIEWALLQAGSASLIATHWNINAKIAAAFLDRFYEHWLGQRHTRAQALVRTVQEFREKSGPLSKPECWAAFSLTGDWR
jgi:hypothetical protein